VTEVRTGVFRGFGKREGLLPLAARLLLGAVFIYASIDKIAHPAAFAEAVYNYQILPGPLIHLTALVLPWMELVLGLFLMSGLFREGSVFMVSALMVIFLSAMVFNLARGLDIHCGCFTTATDSTDDAPMVWYVIRDGLFVIPAVYLFHHTFRGKGRPEGGARITDDPEPSG